MRGRLLSVIVVLGVSGCGASQQQLVQRASFDMSCPESQLQVHQIDSRTRGVRGCGRQAVYVESCNGERNQMNCTWVLNADVVGNGNAVDGVGGSASPPPAGPPAATRIENELRTGLDGRRDAILQCSGGQPVDVLVSYAADGTVSFALAGAFAGTEVEACVRQTLGAVRIDSQGTSGVIQHRVAAAF